MLGGLWQRFARAPLGARLGWAAAAAIVAHASALFGGYVWLDHAHLEGGLAIAPPSGWLDLFRQPFAGTGFYRPLTALSLSIDALADKPGVYHAQNLLWHALASMAVLLAGQSLGVSRRAATLGAVLFAVHPLGSLVAGAIAFRSEAMSLAFLLGLVIAHRRGRPVLAALALLLGGLTKETALVLGPLFVVALEIGGQERRVKVWIAEAIALVAALSLRLAFAPPWRARFPELTASEAIGTRLASLAKSVAAFVLPIEPSVCDAFPKTEAFAALSLVGLGLTFGLLWLGRRGGVVAILLALSILPSLQLVPTLRWWSPHYLYIPAAFALIIVADRVVRRGERAFAIALVAVLALAFVSWQDGRRFASDEMLFGAEVGRDPACREGQFYLGEAHRARREWAAAAARYERALSSPPNVLAFVDLDATLQNLGVVRAELGDFDAARRALEAALGAVRDPMTRRKIQHNLAVVELRDGHPERAVELLAEEVGRPDALPESRAIYARARERLGQGRVAP